MTGPEHYREAERLLERATDEDAAHLFVAAAQVHATLAHAAARALGDMSSEIEAWHAVAGVER